MTFRVCLCLRIFSLLLLHACSSGLDGIAVEVPDSGREDLEGAGPSEESTSTVGGTTSAEPEGEALESDSDSGLPATGQDPRMSADSMDAEARPAEQGAMDERATMDVPVCVGDAGICSMQDTFCQGVTDSHVCVEAALYRCASNGTATHVEDCDSEEGCRLGASAGSCAFCAPGDSFRCDGSSLERCSDDGSAFAPFEECASAALCDDESGLCHDPACEKDTVVCNGQRLQRCRGDLTAFEEIRTCAAGETCDAAAEQCDVCQPGEAICTAGGERQVCSDDGASFVEDGCGIDMHCIGDGECVYCTRDEHCDHVVADEPCRGAICNTATNVCGIFNKELRTTCILPNGDGVGECDRDGKCVDSAIPR